MVPHPGPHMDCLIQCQSSNCRASQCCTRYSDLSDSTQLICKKRNSKEVLPSLISEVNLQKFVNIDEKNFMSTNNIENDNRKVFKDKNIIENSLSKISETEEELNHQEVHDIKIENNKQFVKNELNCDDNEKKSINKSIKSINKSNTDIHVADVEKQSTDNLKKIVEETKSESKVVDSKVHTVNVDIVPEPVKDVTNVESDIGSDDTSKQSADL